MSDRRRSNRVEIIARLHGHVASLDLPIAVRDLSLGGMAIESAVAFPIGAPHEFQLTLGDGSLIELAGYVRYCRNLAKAGEPARYLTGIQFDDHDDDDAGAVDHVIGTVT